MLSKLIEKAEHNPQQRINYLVRHHQNLPYPFCDALCGDLPNYEDAMRALLAGDEAGFEDCKGDWPRDLACRAQALSRPIWQAVRP